MPEVTTSVYTSVYKDHLHLTNADQALIQLIPQVFDGKAFLHWSKTLCIALITKNKLGFVNVRYPKPPETHENHYDWIRTDYTVMRWILHSLDPKIVAGLSYVTSSKQLWDELQERYNQSNAPFLYQLHKDVVQITQGDSSVTYYYAKLRSVWEDNAIFGSYSWMCLWKYEHTRSQILAIKPLPKVNQAFAIVNQVETQKNISNADEEVTTHGSTWAVQQAASVAADPPNVWRRDSKKPKVDRSTFFCEHCKKGGHTLAYCWTYKQWLKAQGLKPPSLRPSGSKKFAANVVETKDYESDTPLEGPSTMQSVQSSMSALDPSFVHAVTKVLFKMQSQASSSDTVGPFAGMMKISYLQMGKEGESRIVAVDAKIIPTRVKYLTGATYFLTIIDDFSRVTWTTLLKSKDTVKSTLQKFLSYVQTQFQVIVLSLRSDNGTKVVQEMCDQLLLDKGIVHQKTIPANSQQNGTVERKYRHLLETAKALRFQAQLPKHFWGDMVLAVTHLINLMPTSVLNWSTPFEALFKKSPDYSHLRVIGCLCYVAHKVGDKFEPRSNRCVFLGYPFAQKGYRLFDLDNKKVILSRDVIFQEKVFPYDPDFKFETSLRTTENTNFPSFQSNSNVGVPGDSFLPDDEQSQCLPSNTSTVNTQASSHRENVANDGVHLQNSELHIHSISNTDIENIALGPVSHIDPNITSSSEILSRQSHKARQLSSRLTGYDCKGLPQSLHPPTVSYATTTFGRIFS
ncbi:uncharacterized protein LOC141641557 [Silene latifolia]|uniref:uncharacterized protein LOC141641557 n=1 Tax=Silene latifolia TaxID=37657 RepID=UPI003D77018B